MRTLSDSPRAMATSFSASQNTPSSDSEVLCPAIFTERLRIASPARRRSGAAGGLSSLISGGAAPAWRRDRKSVVEGKSVSVRVDLGGRRYIKKKKHMIRKNHST